jgi:cation-transporting ATPase I
VNLGALRGAASVVEKAVTIVPRGVAGSLARLERVPRTLGSVFERASAGRSQRRVWAGRGRAHIEVRVVHRPGHQATAARLERALEGIEGVQWAQVNAVMGRVVVVFDPEGPSVDDLVDVVAGFEEAHDLHEERFPHDRPEHPGDVEPIRRNAIAMAADLAGFGVSVFGQLISATPLPTEIASVVSLAEQQPRIRRFLEHHLGVAFTDLGLGLSNALSQALGQGPLGLVVDLVHRANVTGELQARRRTWERREPELAHGRHGAAPAALSHLPRPTPLPSGPVERYADRAALGSVLAMGAALAATRSPRRAAAMFAASVPKGARLGREAFSAHLGRELARRDVVVLDGNVLRRLDRVDTVVLDARVLVSAGVDRQLDPLAESLARAARRDGRRLVMAGRVGALSERIAADHTMPGGRRLFDTVRALQNEGRVVLLVSGGEHQRALAAADCSIGVTGRSASIPWAADLVTRSGLDDARLIVSSVSVARQVSARGALVSLLGSCLGAGWALLGPAPTAGRRAVLPVNVAALVAQLDGVASAELLARRPAPSVATPPSWHAMEGAAVLAALSTTIDGLPRAEVARRLTPRRSEEPAFARLARAVAGELANPLTPVLAAGAGLAGAVGSATDAALVASVTGANAVIGGLQRVRTEATLSRLLELSASTVTVRRSGQRGEVAPDELVPGDIVELSAGEVVPADCRIVRALSLEVDESVLTGESLPVTKSDQPVRATALPERTSMLYEGTSIVNGTAVAVVVATGYDTEVGRSLVDAPPPPPSGVEARLRSLTTVTVPVTLASGASVSGLGLLRGRSPRAAVTSGVSLMVAAVPEGLPILATAAQLAAARRMSERGALVRNPRTMEALGRVDLLCFDKTGTLTAGEIALERVSDGARDEPVEQLGPATRRTLAVALRARPVGNGNDVLPHATDRAVVEGAEGAGVGLAEGVGQWELVAELAFEPARGYHAVVGRTPQGARVAMKGAPEVVVPRCKSWRTLDGTVPIGPRARRQLDAEVERLARQGLRVLAVAESAPGCRMGGRGPAPLGGLSDGDVDELELLGFLGLADRVRPTASHAVETLGRAGVEVVMITGDHPATASAVAKKLGLAAGGVVTGAELDTLDDEALESRLETVSVFARVTPTHKVRIVRAYQRLGRVVAMTGDGANDAPAIRRAHTGIALGAASSPAARQAADSSWSTTGSRPSWTPSSKDAPCGRRCARRSPSWWAATWERSASPWPAPPSPGPRPSAPASCCS